jgi:prepilin-type N-terminal cleavage/methylation domain-containing protein
MERTNIRGLQYHYFRSIEGFSLVELLIVLVISGFMGLGFWGLFGSQSAAYQQQDNVTDMQQNLRSAVERLSRDVMTAGMTGGTPYVIGTNSLTITRCSTGSTAVLSVQANAGSTQLTLGSGQAAFFTVGMDINVGAKENARIIAISGDVLTIDTNIAVSGNQPLMLTHTASDTVCPFETVAYTLVGNTLSVALNGGAATAIANNITAFTTAVDATDPRMLTISLTGRTQGSTPVSSTVTNTVYRRNT